MQRNYRFDPNPVNTHMLLLTNVPANCKVLEVGTASGYLGEYLIHEKKCEVWGIEPMKELYQDASNLGYAKLLNKSAEDVLRDNDLAGQQFDCMLLGDVLEHILNPEQVLTGLRRYLKADGVCVISLPNVGHYSVRLMHLFGKWEYQDAGIMDRTHVKFFTRKTMRELIEKSGFEIITDRPSGGRVERFLRRAFHFGKHVLFIFPELFADQFIFTARPKK